MRHDGIGDMMRYASLNQDLGRLSKYGGFRPVGVFTGGGLPKAENHWRYSDEQLYALSLYLYSLEPPENPNEPSELTRRGKVIFKRENCADCHTPPLYTNNKLVRARGFTVRQGHPEEDAIMGVRVGTDPGLATRTRRGTGFYKVPSLRGVWYRSNFGHSGWCATLEDWFDPQRTQEGYVPTGWKGPPGTEALPVKGHRWGLDLSASERKALIAFLRTLD